MSPTDVRLLHPDRTILQIATDSRQIADGHASVFFAIRGKRIDGHLFVEAAWERGVRNFVIESRDQDYPPDSNVFVVDNSVSALQSLATAYRQLFDLRCIGITGSNGKTWVKEWLTQLLGPDHSVVRSPRSYNSQIGVPLSIFRLREHHNLAIFEAGLSQPGEMEPLARIIRPNIGILTHLGDAHAAGFDSLEEKLAEKCRLFKDVDVVICAELPDRHLQIVKESCPGKTLLTWGSGVSSTMRVEEVSRSVGGTAIQCVYENKRSAIFLPFTDQAALRNGLTCYLTLIYLGYTPEEIARRLLDLRPIQMRLEVHRLPGGCLAINDTYSLDIASLEIGLEALVQHGSGLTKAVVITDIDQQRNGAYEDIAALLNQRGIDLVFTIGEQSNVLHDLLDRQSEQVHFNEMEQAISSPIWRSFSHTAFLLKGARRFGLEKLLQQMQASGHSAQLEIDLNTVLSNIQFFKSKLRSKTRIIAMVKAAAYGSGGAEVARFLEFNNIDMLGVAYTDEGRELRDAGIKLPILVMNPDPSTFRQMIEADLEPEVYSIEHLGLLEQAASRAGVQVNVHLKVDTGMHRLGFTQDALDHIVDTLEQSDHLVVTSIFSHLAAAAITAERDFSHEQARRLVRFHDLLSNAIGYTPMLHLLNTDGILHFPEYQFDAVRIGIGLYGVGLTGHAQYVEPVHTLKARISQVHQISDGETVGYGRLFRSNRPMVVATVNIGYADGLTRRAGDGAWSLIVHDVLCPVLGNVCMDMCMIDVSLVDQLAVGDEVIVFGQANRLEHLATICETIPYEILTNISPRIPRVFKFA